jgi:FkbM family methyltransferase
LAGYPWCNYPSDVKTILRRAARLFPPACRLIDSRDAAIAQRDAAIAQRDAAPTETLRRIMRIASPDTYLHLKLNGYPLWLPRDTIRTMVHCAHWPDDNSLALWVETAHLNWMMERLAADSMFLDVGAATGATTLPVAARFGAAVRIRAYEPAVAARELLIATLGRNAIEGVTVRPVAVSDRSGAAEFREYAQDESGAIPYLPETSSLAAPVMQPAPHRTYTVPVVTLDEDALPECEGPLVIKVDVEGFEAKVLDGARRLIDRHRPHLSIDIHVDPFGDGMATTEAAVIARLQSYKCERLAHVLLCSPRDE